MTVVANSNAPLPFGMLTIPSTYNTTNVRRKDKRAHQVMHSQLVSQLAAQCEAE
jgi:hypothetical protein